MKIFHLCFAVSIIFLAFFDGSAQESRQPASVPPSKEQIELEAKAFDSIAPVIGRSNDLIDAYVLIGSCNDAEYPYYSEDEIVFAAQDGYSSYKHKYRASLKRWRRKISTGRRIW